MIRVRFAPAPTANLPTGNLSFNSARVALANYLFALRGNERMLLRLDDLDQERARSLPATDVWADQIMQDLRWFGIDWDESFRQSGRLDLYQQTIDRLKRDKLIYPCFESEEELKAKQEFRRKRNQPLIYDRAMLALTAQQRQDAEAGGKRPHWRFKLSGRTLDWTDLVLGPRQATLATVSDPVLVRADGLPMPILASVVDDIDRATTHIIRAEDNAGNTAVQIWDIAKWPVLVVLVAVMLAATFVAAGEERSARVVLEVLRLLAAERGVERRDAVLDVVRTPKHCLGVYAEVVTPGRVAVGDAVVLTDQPD